MVAVTDKPHGESRLQQRRKFIFDEYTEIIKVSGLTMGFGSNVLMQDLNFSIRRGETFVILGTSGCGKSTLMRHLIGLERAQAGQIEIENELFIVDSPSCRESILSKIGVMFQSGALFGSMDVLENVCYPLREKTHLSKQAIEKIAEDKLALVGLSEFAHHQTAELSGGMQKRAAIARAMVMDPKILFLDEPSAGLDPITAATIDELLLQLSENLGTTLVLVTHELRSIFTVADRMIMLDKESQGIIAMGHPKTVADQTQDPKVWNFFYPGGKDVPL